MFFCYLAVKLTGKLQDGTVFMNKGHDEEEFEFKIDEGNGQSAKHLTRYMVVAASGI